MREELGSASEVLEQPPPFPGVLSGESSLVVGVRCGDVYVLVLRVLPSTGGCSLLFLIDWLFKSLLPFFFFFYLSVFLSFSFVPRAAAAWWRGSSVMLRNAGSARPD